VLSVEGSGCKLASNTKFLQDFGALSEEWRQGGPLW